MIISRRGNGNGALLSAALCCLGFLLFIIASTIVVSLIPIYLSRRNGGQAHSVQGSLRQVTYSLPSSTTYLTGSLTQAQLAYLVGHVIKSIYESHLHFVSF
jgi:hypothetical protein